MIDQDSRLQSLLDYATNVLHLQLTPLCEGADSLTRKKGGAGAALLREVRTGVVLVHLVITMKDGTSECSCRSLACVAYNYTLVHCGTGYDHCVTYSAELKMQGYEQYTGAVFDNDKNVPIKLVEEQDRHCNQRAHALFRSFFPSKSVAGVFVQAAWRMQRQAM